ncbi:sulfotransferase 1A3-like [Ptychodera flava]|uniref:sulfotransferase 1A3-like n=1 Tax=Ptychodera flava TaxID=63121 RepID=UPI00396AAECB
MAKNQLPDDFKPPPDHFYKGIRMPAQMPAASLDAAREMEIRDDDIWVVTYPKAGTTWGQEITSVIMEGGDIEKVKKTPLLERVPYVELGPIDQIPATHKFVDAMPRDVPRLIRTHVPYDLMPKQWHEKKPKTLYVARNPKDTAISGWQFTKINYYLETVENFSDFFPKFIEGDVIYGSWFDHNLGFWQHRHEPHILFVKFEDMKKDLKGQMIRIADFYGRPLPEDKIEECVEHCTFDKMKKNPMSNYSAAPFLDHKKGTFHRKGEVGDWMNYFTVHQNEMFNSLFEEKMRGSGLTFDFEL